MTTDAFEFVLSRAAELAADTGPYVSAGEVIDIANADSQRVLAEDALDVLVIRANDAASAVSDTTAWAITVDLVSQMLGCETKHQRFAVELLVVAAFRLTGKEDTE